MDGWMNEGRKEFHILPQKSSDSRIRMAGLKASFNHLLAGTSQVT